MPETPPSAARKGRLPLILLILAACVVAGCDPGRRGPGRARRQRRPARLHLALRTSFRLPRQSRRSGRTSSAGRNPVPGQQPHSTARRGRNRRGHVAGQPSPCPCQGDGGTGIAPSQRARDRRSHAAPPEVPSLGRRRAAGTELQSQRDHQLPERRVRLAGSKRPRRGALPILFAEWPRRGIDETQIILDAYRAIALREPACLPPIPETFAHVLAQDSRLRLRAGDGNHSSAAGAFLASLILYATISGEDVASLPDLAEPRVSPVLQRHLRGRCGGLLRIPPRAGAGKHREVGQSWHGTRRGGCSAR